MLHEGHRASGSHDSVTDKIAQAFAAQTENPSADQTDGFGKQKYASIPLSPAQEQKIQRNKEEDERFSQSIQAYLRGDYGNETVFRVGTTPYCMRIVGAKAIPVVISQSVLFNSLASGKASKAHTEGHDIPPETLEKIPEAIRNPIFVCRGHRPDTLAVICDLTDKEQRNLLVAFALDVQGAHSKVNRITTVFGKKNITQFVQKTIDSDGILAMNIKKAEKLSSHIGIQSPKSATILCFDDSIPYSDENVKKFSEISSQSDGLRMQESSLTDQIDAVLNHTDNRYNNSIRLCDTPEIFVQIGLSHLPMLYAKKHLRDALKPKNPKKPHQHGLTVSQIKNIPEWLAAPAIIFDFISPSANGRNSIVTVLNAVDQDNAPLLVTITPNGQGVYQLESIPANCITSIYGKENNFATYIERAATAGNILFWDKNKSQDLFSVLELQLPQGLKDLDSNIIIRKSTAIVNSNLQIFDPKKPITSERRAAMLAAFAAKHNLEDLNVFVKKDKSYRSDGRAYDLIVKDGKSEVFSTLLFTLEPGEVFTESVLQTRRLLPAAQGSGRVLQRTGAAESVCSKSTLRTTACTACGGCKAAIHSECCSAAHHSVLHDLICKGQSADASTQPAEAIRMDKRCRTGCPAGTKPKNQ